MDRSAKLTFPLMSLEETAARLGVPPAHQMRILEILKSGQNASNGHRNERRMAVKRAAAKRAAKRRT